MDRGFLFGDGIYEVIPSYGGRLVGFAPHLERMQDGLDALLRARFNEVDLASRRNLHLQGSHISAAGRLQHWSAITILVASVLG